LAVSDESPHADASERVYQRRLDALVRELQLFAASNLALFAAIAVVCVSCRERAVSLILPAAILTATTLAAAALYALAGDWLWSFLTGEYVGVYYLVSIGIVSALLVDIVCNRARLSNVIARALWYWPM
jgi:hypothetical protein